MSGWATAANVVETLAPTIGTALGGPLVGGAISALESVFGISPAPKSSLDQRKNDIAMAISGATPEQLAAVRAKDQEYALAMQQAGFKDIETLASLKVQDAVSARDMQSKNKSVVPGWLTFVVTFGFFGLVAALFVYPVPDSAKAIIYSAAGTLGTVWLVIVHFWFGSTSDTGQVNELLANSTPGAKK